ncbi:MAG: ADP/ATP-dependent (S)-NAD(P)H-hydrate dehydratase, partial [Planctomycetia bacterium]|nr:ADP/ATP-dependent (S)-NAD(P)H-hydrate dehydratase [Planctomycetia bacterium]
PRILTLPEGPRILTPHPGEFARMIGHHGEPDVPKRSRTELLPIAVERARQWKSIIVLKGAGTLVTDGVRQYVNTTGNPGMATGGSGDVLTGVIVSLLAQGLEAFDAAVLGVYLHGLAGDLASRRLGEYGMTAMDIVASIPPAIRRYQESQTTSDVGKTG